MYTDECKNFLFRLCDMDDGTSARSGVHDGASKLSTRFSVGILSHLPSESSTYYTECDSDQCGNIVELTRTREI